MRQLALVIIALCLIPLLYAAIPSDSKAAADTTSAQVVNDSLFYQADSLHYDAILKQLRLRGHAGISYEKSTIGADTISVDSTRKAKVQGHITIKDAATDMLGERAFYDFNAQTGLIEWGAAKFDKGFYYGTEMRKIDDGVYDVDDGRFTTCDDLDPCFWIETNKMRIYQNDKVVGKPIWFYVNDFPVFWFPYGAFSIKQGRRPGILLPMPGYNSTDGKTLRNLGYYYPYKDYADITLSADYLEKTGWETEADLAYTKRYEYNGSLNWRRQTVMNNGNVTNANWALTERHHHELGHDRTFDLNLHFVSSKDIYADEVDEDERLSETLTSSFAYKQPLFGRSLYVSGEYSDNLSTKVKDASLPAVSYVLPGGQIGKWWGASSSSLWNDFSYNYSLRGVHSAHVEGSSSDFSDFFTVMQKDSLNRYTVKNNYGVKQTAGLNWSHKLKWFNLKQSFSYDEGWYDRDENGNTLARGYDWRYGSGVSFTLYGLSQPNLGWLKAMRHVATPSVNYSYSPDFSHVNDDLFSFGGVGVSESKRSQTMSFGLSNAWQLKIPGADNKDIKLNDFFSVNSSLSWNLEKQKKAFSDISHSSRLNPGSLKFGVVTVDLSNDGTLTQDPYNYDVKRWGLSSSLTLSGSRQYTDYFPALKNPFTASRIATADSTAGTETTANSFKKLDDLNGKSDGWSLSTSWDYARDEVYHNTTTNLKNELKLRVTRYWEFTYSQYYNLEKNQLVSQSLSAKRDLGCWEIDFRYYKSGDFWDFRIVLFNIKLPDALKVEHKDHSF